MARQQRCTATTQSGGPCGSFAVRDGLCVSHHPELRARKAEGSRRGGEAKANARRAAKQWAAAGEVMAVEDLPAMLMAAMLEVRAGTLEPSQAQAIAALAKSSMSLAEMLELRNDTKAEIQEIQERLGIDLGAHS